MLGPEKVRMEWYLALILMISIIIGGFQVFNTVFSSVLERIRELGLMKAIGFNPSYVIKMVITESSLIGLIAGLFGSLLAATMALISAQVFYGLSLPNTVFARIIANSFGGTSLENPFLRNSTIAIVTWVVIAGILAYLWPREYETYSSLFMITSFLLFLLLVRPTDPFTVDRLVEIAPDLTTGILGGVLFATTLSTLAGSYVAYTAGKIKPSEAMRHV
jgi:ABC-type antimicrobial peptide transport system permease subunit